MIEMLSGQGHALSDLLAAAGLPRSTYYRARSHPPRPTRPELWEKVAEV
ncbi:IS3 family transposase, partial [Eggerthella lenta]|nr:IS3 family transposase [Eggerthella lenta]